LPQELVVGASVHLPLYGFDSADLAFDRTCGPGGRDSSFHRIDVAGDSVCEAGKLAVGGHFEPFFEPRNVAPAKERDELHCQFGGRREFRCLGEYVTEEQGVFGIDLIERLAQIPGAAPT
jgi:hypothetical protein